MKKIILVLLLTLSFNVNAQKIGAFEAHNMPISDFVTWFADTLQLNVVLASGVQGGVTFSAPSLDPADFMPFVETILNSNGYKLENNGKFYQVSLLRAGDELPTLTESDLQNLNIEQQNQVNIVPPMTKFYDLAYIENTKAKPLIDALLRDYSENTGETMTAHSMMILPNSNSFIVTGSPSQIVQIDNLMSRIDVRKKQVFVQAVVIESQVNNGQELGVNLDAMLGNWGFEINTIQNGGVITGGNIIFNGGDIDGLINAVATNSKTKLLSKPHLLITDRERGYISVGQNVPFLTSTEATDGGNVIQTIERQDVGVSLSVTPHIIGDSVIMKINQTSSSVSNSDIASDIITNNRQIQTVIQAKNGQSVILGGLVGEESRESGSGVPVLSKIPLIGMLFSSSSDRDINNQLSVLIKVTIL